MVKYEIEENLVKGVLEYLAKRPYMEVAQAVNELQRLKQIDETDAEPVEPKQLNDKQKQ